MHTAADPMAKCRGGLRGSDWEVPMTSLDGII